MSRTSTLRQMPRLSLLACALATALPAVAQSVGNGGRFTPVIGQAHSLYPSSLTTTDAPPQAMHILRVASSARLTRARIRWAIGSGESSLASSGLRRNRTWPAPGTGSRDIDSSTSLSLFMS